MASGMLHHSNEEGWGSLPPELIALCLRCLTAEVHAERGGWLTVQQAAQLLAACSANSSWRAVGLSEVCCRVRLDDAAEVLQLSAAAIPCCAVQLPPPAAAHWCCHMSAWQAQARLHEAVAQLLQGGSAFAACSRTRLRELLGCPLAVAEAGGLAGFTALHRLSLAQGLSIGSPTALHGSRLPGCPPSLQHLHVALPAGGTLCQLRWPQGLHRCSVLAAGGMPSMASSLCRVQPCSCAACWVAGFWATCRALDVEAGSVSMCLHACRALRSCTSLRLAAGAGHSTTAAHRAEAAAGQAVAPDLQPWLAALAPLFASTPLRSFELRAARAWLTAGPTGAPAELWASHLHPRAQQALQLPGAGSLLAAEALPPGHYQAAAHPGLVAELCRDGSSQLLSLCIARQALE